MSVSAILKFTTCAALFAGLCSFQLPIYDVCIVLQQRDSLSHIVPVADQPFLFVTNNNRDTYNLKTDANGKSQSIFLPRGTYLESKIVIEGYNVAMRHKIKVKREANVEIFLLSKSR